MQGVPKVGSMRAKDKKLPTIVRLVARIQKFQEELGGKGAENTRLL